VLVLVLVVVLVLVLVLVVVVVLLLLLTTLSSLPQIRKAILQLAKAQKGAGSSKESEDRMDALKKYAIDLVERAASGKLDPVIGRDGEVRRVVQVLSRRRKNNPVLIGEPGVGKVFYIRTPAPAVLLLLFTNFLKQTPPCSCC